MRADLQGRAAIVTGAARGIGEAIARALAANGAGVLLADVDHEAASAVAASLPDALALRMDVRDEAQIGHAVSAALQRWSRLDILVNNAGVNTLAHRVTLEAVPVEEWDRIVDIDLKGTFLVSRAALPPMLERGFGRIVNIASIVGLVSLRLQTPFVAAKAGVINMTRSMATEFGPRGIRVNAIAPGSTLTEGTRRLFYGEDGSFSARVRDMLAHVPLGRPGTVDEIAACALFLADPAIGFVNGHTLVADGGWTAGWSRR